MNVWGFGVFFPVEIFNNGVSLLSSFISKTCLCGNFNSPIKGFEQNTIAGPFVSLIPHTNTHSTQLGSWKAQGLETCLGWLNPLEILNGKYYHRLIVTSTKFLSNWLIICLRGSLNPLVKERSFGDDCNLQTRKASTHCHPVWGKMQSMWGILYFFLLERLCWEDRYLCTIRRNSSRRESSGKLMGSDQAQSLCIKHVSKEQAKSVYRKSDKEKGRSAGWVARRCVAELNWCCLSASRAAGLWCIPL